MHHPHRKQLKLLRRVPSQQGARRSTQLQGSLYSLLHAQLYLQVQEDQERNQRELAAAQTRMQRYHRPFRVGPCPRLLR